MAKFSYFQFHVNGQQTFFVNEEILARFSHKLSKIINQEKKTKSLEIEIDDFPGGPDGFELVTRFCYNNGSIEITASNVALLHCCAIFLDLKDELDPSCNLFRKTETFLESLFYWSWSDLLICIKSCGPFLYYADSIGLVQKLICSLLAKIAQNTDVNLIATSSLSASSSFSSSSSSFSPTGKGNWWFNDLTVLPPNVVEVLVRTLEAYGEENNSLVLTKFLLHYLKTVPKLKNTVSARSYCSGLADTVIYGVVFLGKPAFSCRGLFSVLRTVGGFGPSKECISILEKEIGSVLDAATLDDLLVVRGDKKARGAYDVELVMRLVKLFVGNDDGDDEVLLEKMKKVGRLIDEYLAEIAPDQSLKVSNFIGILESLPDFARDSFDGVYGAIDIYLQSHNGLSEKERLRICRCLNYSKLSLETSKDLAKNPKIPPTIAIQALASQHPNVAPSTSNERDDDYSTNQIVSYNNNNKKKKKKQTEEKREGDIMSLEKMQWRVVELEKLCLEMKGQMSKMVKGKMSKTVTTRPSPRNRFMPSGC